MAVAVVDANILIDYEDTSSDTRHERAENIVYAIDRGDLPTARITDYVLLESLNWIHRNFKADATGLAPEAVDLRGQRLNYCRTGSSTASAADSSSAVS